MNKRKSMILFTILALAGGFASITTSLYMNASSSISTNEEDTDVYFSKVIINDVENKAVIEDDNHIVFTVDTDDLGEEYNIEYEVTNSSSNYDAEVSVTCSDSTEYLSVLNTFDTSTNLEAKETRLGTLNIKQIKSRVGSDINNVIECTITENLVSRTGLVTKTAAAKVNNWELSEDNNSNGNADIGDIICLSTECFYVISNDGSRINALARYNLYVGSMCTSADESSCTALTNPTGLQDSDAVGYHYEEGTTNGDFPTIGATKYGDTSAYSTSTVKTYVDEYKTKLDDLKGYIIEARLLTKEEVETLLNEGNTLSNGTITSIATNTTGREWVYSTTFWLSTPYDDNQVWRFYSFGDFGYGKTTSGNGRGVRPVVTINEI